MSRLPLIFLVAACADTTSRDADLSVAPAGADLAVSDLAVRADLAISGGLNANQKAVAEALTSIWENDTPALDYAYSENLHDGRGYTSGRAGFCTGTGDAIQVVQCFQQLHANNLLSKYLPALTQINDAYMSSGQDQGDTSLLDAVGNFPADWAASYNDAATQADFKLCQDHISDLLYYQPAMQAATQHGLQNPLTRAALYDMWINQGDDTLVRQTVAAVGAGASEDQWLQKFLELRRDLLAGDATWAQSVDRVAGYEKARRRGNTALAQPIDSDVKAAECWPAGGYADSGYTAYLIQPDATWTTTSQAPGCN